MNCTKTLLFPFLSVAENGKLFEFENTYLVERPWQLSAMDASLPESYNPLIRPSARTGMLDISQAGKIETSEIGESKNRDFIYNLHQAAMQLGPVEWTQENLIMWLDNHITHQDIPVGESVTFFRML